MLVTVSLANSLRSGLKPFGYLVEPIKMLEYPGSSTWPTYTIRGRGLIVWLTFAEEIILHCYEYLKYKEYIKYLSASMNRQWSRSWVHAGVSYLGIYDSFDYADPSSVNKIVDMLRPIKANY